MSKDLTRLIATSEARDKLIRLYAARIAELEVALRDIGQMHNDRGNVLDDAVSTALAALEKKP